MAEFSIGSLKVRVCFGFFAAVMFYFYFSGEDSAGVVAALLSCFLHELGHLSAMFLFGCPPERLTLYAGGLRLTGSYTKQPSRPQELVILSAGCAVNLALAVISHFIGAQTLALVNLSLMLTNLLPFSALDGGRILALFGSRLRKTAAAVTAVLLAAAVYHFGLSPCAMLFIAFAAVFELFA